MSEQDNTPEPETPEEEVSASAEADDQGATPEKSTESSAEEAPAEEIPEVASDAGSADGADTPDSESTGEPDEKKVAAELGIGGVTKSELDQSGIDALLGAAVIGYEEIFKGTVLDGDSGAAQAAPVADESSPQHEEILDYNLKLLKDVNMKVKVELGRGNMYLKDILTLGQGSVVELERLAGDPLDIYVNEKVIARGEVLVLNENFCIRITEIYDPAEAIRIRQ